MLLLNSVPVRLQRRSRQYLSCALVRGRAIVFHHYYRNMAKSSGQDMCDGAVVPFELLWSWIVCVFLLQDSALFLAFSLVNKGTYENDFFSTYV